MKQRGPIGFLILLGIPSLALLLFVLVEPRLSCEINPWAGYTCPRGYGALYVLAAIGALTIVPFSLIGGVWCVMTTVIWGAKKRQPNKTNPD